MDDEEKVFHKLKTAPPPRWPYEGISIPMLRRIMPGLIASEIIGVQPMTETTGKLYTMKSNYSTKKDTE